MSSHHEVLACQADGVDGALHVDRGLLLQAARVGEVDLGAAALHDVLEVGAVAAHHEEVVLRGDVQLRAHRDGARQAARQVLQQHRRTTLQRKRRKRRSKRIKVC